MLQPRFWLHLLILSLCSYEGFADNLVARDGVIDLRSWDGASPVSLSGDYEFYWGEHFDSRALLDKSVVEPNIIFVPGTWRGEQFDGSDLPGNGIATYRLNILIPVVQPYALQIPDIGTSYRLYLDGDLAAAAGTAGTSAQTSVPAYDPKVIEFTPTGNRIELVVQVSNFNYRSGGIWLPLYFGTPEQISEMTENQRALDLLLVGAILILGFYVLALYGMRREDPSSLYLGLFCLLLAFRLLTVGERFLTEIVDLPFEWFVRLEYLSWLLAVSAFAAFLNAVLPREFNRVVTWVIHGIIFVSSVTVLLTQVATFTELVTLFQVVTIGCMIAGSVSFVLAVVHKQEGALILMLSYVVLFYAVVNDILINAGVINTYLMLDMGILVFIFFQSTLISYRFTRSFKMIESQSASLQAANLRLRTQEKLRLAAESATEELQKRDKAYENMAIIETVYDSMKDRVDAFLELIQGQPQGRVLEDLVLIITSSESQRESVDLNKLIAARKRSGARISLNLDGQIPAIRAPRSLIERVVLAMIEFFAAHTKSLCSVETYHESTEDRSLFYDDISAGDYVVLGFSCDGPNTFVAENFEHIFDADNVVQLHTNHQTGLGLILVSKLMRDLGGGVGLLLLGENGVRMELYLPT